MSNEYSLKELLPFLELDEYISFDLETTGLNPEKDKITEIAASRFVNGEFSEQFTTLINPEIPIPKNISALTGITNKMVENSPIINDVLPDLIEFIGSTPLVAQNINFDYSFINNNLSTTDSPLSENPLYDTLSLARGFIYFHNSFSLGSLCDYYGIKIENAHRAGTDALCTGKLFAYLIQEVLSKPLTLIQRVDNLFGNAKVFNSNLFKNIIKTSVRLNKIDGLMPAPINNNLSDNIYELIR